MKTKPQVIFYAGTNGSGKSSLREYDNESLLQIDPDVIARAINPLAPRSVDIAAGRIATTLFADAIKNKQSFSIETTLTGKGVLRRMQLAKDAGFGVTLKYVGLNSLDLNKSRIAQRVERGGHHIDDAVVERRYSESLENLKKASLIADRTMIFDNSGQKHELQVDIQNRQVCVLVQDEIQWVRNIRQQLEKTLASTAELKKNLINTPISDRPKAEYKPTVASKGLKR